MKRTPKKLQAPSFRSLSTAELQLAGGGFGAIILDAVKNAMKGGDQPLEYMTVTMEDLQVSS